MPKKKNGPVHNATDYTKTRELIEEMERLKLAYDRSQGKR